MNSNDSGGTPQDDERDPNANEKTPTKLTMNKELRRRDVSYFKTHFENPYTHKLQEMKLHVHDVLNALLNGKKIPLEDNHTGRAFDVSIKVLPDEVTYRRWSDDEVVTRQGDQEPVTVELGGNHE